jgi:hypothetical protein
MKVLKKKKLHILDYHLMELVIKLWQFGFHIKKNGEFVGGGGPEKSFVYVEIIFFTAKFINGKNTLI